MVAQALRTEKPISFLATGQQIPEDLQEADAEKIVARFLAPGKADSAVSAA
jgi:flagellar biosynthesis GTPase FlhF